MNRSKAKGTAAESAVRDYLQSYGLDARRVALAGAADQGDVHVRDWCLEVKAVRAASFRAWLKEAENERQAARRTFAAVVHKPTGVAAPARYHVVMTLDEFRRVLQHIEALEAGS